MAKKHHQNIPIILVIKDNTPIKIIPTLPGEVAQKFIETCEEAQFLFFEYAKQKGLIPNNLLKSVSGPILLEKVKGHFVSDEGVHVVVCYFTPDSPLIVGSLKDAKE